MIEEVFLKSCIREELWDLRQADPEQFKREVRIYFEKRYPEWAIVKAKYPFIYLRRNEH